MSEEQQVGRILTPEGWVAGRIVYDAHIRAIEPGAVAASAPAIIPGFVDLHVPGGGGADVMQGADAVRTAARSTPVTDDVIPARDDHRAGRPERRVVEIGEVQGDRQPGEARVLGAHMEGPFINTEKLGAQPPHARLPETDFIAEVCAGQVVKLVTIAPEIEGGLRRSGHFPEWGSRCRSVTPMPTMKPPVGHWMPARGFTHLFNAMSALHHRAPSVTGAALARGEYAAIIPDGVHVADGALRAALRAIPKLFCVTDATAAAGMPDGEYPLGSQTVT